MKQIYIIYILLLTFLGNNAWSQTCTAPLFADGTAPPGTTSINMACGGGTASMSATFNGLGTISTNRYSVAPTTFNFTTFTGTTIPITTDDIWSSVITLPFNFCFFGTSYNRLLVGSNGVLSFDVTTAGGYCTYVITAPLPSASYPRAIIGGVYNDIDPRYGAPTRKIQYTTVGTAPCRQFIVSFEGISFYGSACPGTYANYQIILNETTNIIDVQIQNHGGCSSTNAGRGIIGIQDYGRTSAYAAPGRNAVTFSTANEAWRFAPIDTSSAFRRMIVQLFDNGVLVDSAVPYYSPFPTLRADFTRAITFPPDSHTFHVELMIYDSTTTTGSGSSLCTVATAALYDFNDLVYYNSGSLNLNSAVANVSCFGLSDGSIDLTAITTAPPVSYSWTSGPTTEDRTGLPAGSYTVTASDLGGCTVTRTFVVTEPPELMVMPMMTTDVTCRGGNDGSIDVMIMGGTAPYASSWTGGSSSEDLMLAAAGYYCTVVTDSHGCTANYCDTIEDGSIDSTIGSVFTCAGDSVLFNGILLGASGVYADTFASINGCDSIYTITLTVGSSVFSTVNPSICLGDTFRLGGLIYTSTGVYYDTAVSISGCDSLIRINLTVNNPSSFILNSRLCVGSSIRVGTNVYSIDGTYYDTLVNIKGCDSFITTNLTINLPTASTIDTVICAGQFVRLGTTNYNSTGTYFDTLVNSNGCDSTVTLNLLVHPINNVVDSFVICAGQTILGYSPTDDTLISSLNNNIYGCDSTYGIFIRVQDLPKADLGDDRNIYVGDTVLLVVLPGYTYNWSNGATTNRNFVSPPTTTTYSVTITDSIGCVDSGHVVVNVSPLSSPIAFPSAFTPNGDGLNDNYYPLLPIGSTLTGMVIYNRWGGVVYSGTSAPGWDGTTSGSPAHIGNYVYYITITRPDPLDPLLTITEYYTGTITLLR